MLYFKNVELASKYHVSLGTIRHWIKAAQESRLDLILHTDANRSYIANTPANLVVMDRLAEEGKKFRNTRTAKTVSPKPQFYELFNEQQIYDIATNMEVYHEIPRQYNFFGPGAVTWNAYAEHTANESIPNLFKATIQLLDDNQSYIDSLLKRFKRVNIVDIGVGNAKPIKGVLAHLLDQGKLGRYIAFDISTSMLALAKQNIHEWFGDQVPFESHVIDINYDRFHHTLIQEYARPDAEDTVNLVLLLGGTLMNMRESDKGYQIIHDSMGVNDYFIHTDKLDTPITRTYLDRNYYNIDPDHGAVKLSPLHGLVADLMGIDETFYEIETGYDATKNERFERIRLTVSLTIHVELKGGVHDIELNKGDTILTWRATHTTDMDTLEQFQRVGFHTLHASQTDDETYILTVSRVSKKN